MPEAPALLLTSEQASALRAHVQQKWGPSPTCPMCRCNAWTIHQMIFQLPAVNRPHNPFSTTYVPVGVVQCDNCLYVALVNLLAAGVVKREALVQHSVTGDRPETTAAGAENAEGQQ